MLRSVPSSPLAWASWPSRFVPGLAKNKWALFFPAFILALNIGEAVVRDFEVYALHATGQVIDGMGTLSGPWNIMNGIAGILNLVTISGWLGIFFTKDKKRDMIWPDMLWFWVLAYDLWNFAYGYNCRRRPFFLLRTLHTRRSNHPDLDMAQGGLSAAPRLYPGRLDDALYDLLVATSTIPCSP